MPQEAEMSAEVEQAIELVNRLQDEAIEQHEGGDCLRAIETSMRALRALEEAAGLEEPNLALILLSLGNLQTEVGRTADAASSFQRAGVLLTKDALGPEWTPMRVQADRQLGECLVQLERHGDAKVALTRARERCAALEGDETLPIEMGMTLNALGMVCKHTGRFEEGRRHFREALRILTDACGAETFEVAAVLHNQGSIEHAAGSYLAALGPAREAVEITRKLVGEDHPAFARDITALAAVLCETGNLEEAEEQLLTALRILEASYGKVHLETGVVWQNLGIAAVSRGESVTAGDRFRRAVEIKRVALHPNSPDLAISLVSLGSLLCDGDPMKQEEGRALLVEARDIFIAAFGAAHPNTRACQSALDAIGA
jgi:tetratricopeptide (TPR) repeat protein